MKTKLISLIIIVGAIFSPASLFADEPEDFTNRLTNPDFEYMDDGVLNTGVTRGIPYGWSVTGELQLDVNGNQSYGIQTNDASNFHGNSLCWINSVPMPEDFELYQEIEGLPAGQYSVYCRLAVREGSMTNQRLFANNSVQYFGAESDYVQNLTGEEDNTFSNHMPIYSFELKDMVATVIIAEGETLKLGIRSSNLLSDGTRVTDNNSGWFKVDYFRLVPYTEATEFLSDLILNGDTLKDFDPAIDYYETYLPYGTTSLKIEPIVAEIGSTVSISGSISEYDYVTGLLTWSGDGDLVEIEVTSSGGIKMTYNLDIYVEEGTSDSHLKNIELSAGLLDPVFHYLTEKYTLVVPKGTESVELTAMANFPGAVVVGEGTIPLSNGEAEVNLTVTSSDGTSVSTYTISIVEDASYTLLLTNPDFEYSSVDVLNDGSTFRGLPYGWSAQGELIGNSFGINNDGTNYNGNNLCWINSSPMPDEYELYQVVEGLPKGDYIVQCRLVVMSDRVTNQRLFANNQVQYFGDESMYTENLTLGEENTFAGWTPTSAYSLQEMEVKVSLEQDEPLKLGIRSGNLWGDGSREISNNAGWFKVDHFRIEAATPTSAHSIPAQKSGIEITNTKDQLFVNVVNPGKGEISIYSLIGSLVLQEQIAGNKTVVHVSKPGVYIVKVVNDGEMFTKKIYLY